MTYSVTITSTDGKTNTYACAGSNDQEALIHAGKIVQEKADAADPEATIQIRKGDDDIGPASTVGDMTSRAV